MESQSALNLLFLGHFWNILFSTNEYLWQEQSLYNQKFLVRYKIKKSLYFLEYVEELCKDRSNSQEKLYLTTSFTIILFDLGPSLKDLCGCGCGCRALTLPGEPG